MLSLHDFMLNNEHVSVVFFGDTKLDLLAEDINA